jgi:hypothetical protein
MTDKSSNDPMDKTVAFGQAQSDMRTGYANGSTGVIVSGFVWLTSAFVSFLFSADQAIWILLIGGALINPVSSVLEKSIGLKGHNSGNPLRNLAMESTIWMIMCIPLAYGLSLQNVAWFFQGMLLIIGGRYLTFATLFGNRLYWILATFLGAAAYLLFKFEVQSFGSILTGSIIEIAFGTAMSISFRKTGFREEKMEY